MKAFISSNGSDWTELPDEPIIVYSLSNATVGRGSTLLIESFTYELFGEYTVKFRPFYYVKIALECMSYWLGEMAREGFGKN